MSRIKFHVVFLHLCKIIKTIIYEKEGGSHYQKYLNYSNPDFLLSANFLGLILVLVFVFPFAFGGKKHSFLPTEFSVAYFQVVME